MYRNVLRAFQYYLPEAEMKFLKWLDNFWYHHKWKTIISLFLIVVLTVCIAQLVEKEDYDACVMYVGAATNGIPKSIEARLEELMGGEKYNVNFSRLTYDPDNNLASEANVTAQKQLANMIVMPYYIYIMDKEVYELYKNSGVFVPLSDIYGEDLPEFANDDFSLIYSETEFAKTHTDDDTLPEGAVIALKVKPYSWSKKAAAKEEAKYSVHEELFKKIAWQ